MRVCLKLDREPTFQKDIEEVIESKTNSRGTTTCKSTFRPLLTFKVNTDVESPKDIYVRSI